MKKGRIKKKNRSAKSNGWTAKDKDSITGVSAVSTSAGLEPILASLASNLQRPYLTCFHSLKWTLLWTFLKQAKWVNAVCWDLNAQQDSLNKWQNSLQADINWDSSFSAADRI